MAHHPLAATAARLLLVTVLAGSVVACDDDNGGGGDDGGDVGDGGGVDPGADAIQAQFGDGFRTAFEADANDEPIDPAPGDLVDVDRTADPIDF